MMKPCRLSIAFSMLSIVVTLFASGCIGESDIGECDMIEHVSGVEFADEGVDPCGNEEDDADADVDEREPAIEPAALCTTPSCNKYP